MSTSRVAVYGGKGHLGSVLVDYFKSKKFWTLCIDFTINEKADANIIVDRNVTWTEQERMVLKAVSETLDGATLDAILCVAGGWAGTNAASLAMIKDAELMWKQSVWSSSIAARIASMHLKKGGLLQLTGAASVVNNVPSALGYHMAKAAVHQLAKSLALKKSGMPEGATTVALLPSMLDTYQNRAWMSNANTDSWTSLESVAELLHKWIVDPSSRPSNGALVEIITKNKQNELKMH